jgi:hypothetical protein
MRSRPYPRPAPAVSEVTRLGYRGPVPMVLRGPGSQQLYRLTAPEQVVEADPRDVAALLRTGWFVG